VVMLSYLFGEDERVIEMSLNGSAVLCLLAAFLGAHKVGRHVGMMGLFGRACVGSDCCVVCCKVVFRG
jgi:hypothetical protein